MHRLKDYMKEKHDSVSFKHSSSSMRRNYFQFSCNIRLNWIFFKFYAYTKFCTFSILRVFNHCRGRFAKNL